MYLVCEICTYFFPTSLFINSQFFVYACIHTSCFVKTSVNVSVYGCMSIDVHIHTHKSHIYNQRNYCTLYLIRSLFLCAYHSVSAHLCEFFHLPCMHHECMHASQLLVAKKTKSGKNRFGLQYINSLCVFFMCMHPLWCITFRLNKTIVLTITSKHFFLECTFFVN